MLIELIKYIILWKRARKMRKTEKFHSILQTIFFSIFSFCANIFYGKVASNRLKWNRILMSVARLYIFFSIATSTSILTMLTRFYMFLPHFFLFDGKSKQHTFFETQVDSREMVFFYFSVLLVIKEVKMITSSSSLHKNRIFCTHIEQIYVHIICLPFVTGFLLKFLIRPLCVAFTCSIH